MRDSQNSQHILPLSNSKFNQTQTAFANDSQYESDAVSSVLTSKNPSSQKPVPNRVVDQSISQNKELLKRYADMCFQQKKR